MPTKRATPRITPRQREVLDHLTKRGALAPESARDVPGFDEVPADKLAAAGVLNKRYVDTYGAVYWIRGEDEEPTGTHVPAGFVVILHRDVTTPSGRAENFFLARAPYDGRSITFRRLLQGWMCTLGLRNKDLLNGVNGSQLIGPDSPVFQGDHLILDSLHEGGTPTSGEQSRAISSI